MPTKRNASTKKKRPNTPIARMSHEARGRALAQARAEIACLKTEALLKSPDCRDLLRRVAEADKHLTHETLRAAREARIQTQAARSVEVEALVFDRRCLQAELAAVRERLAEVPFEVFRATQAELTAIRDAAQQEAERTVRFAREGELQAQIRHLEQALANSQRLVDELDASGQELRGRLSLLEARQVASRWDADDLLIQIQALEARFHATAHAAIMNGHAPEMADLPQAIYFHGVRPELYRLSLNAFYEN